MTFLQTDLKTPQLLKKLAIFDAFEILNRIEEEERILNNKPKQEIETSSFGGFAENRSK